MAVAVKNTAESKTEPAQSRLAVASLLGAVYIIAAAAVVFYGVPHLWATGVSPSIESMFGPASFVDATGKLGVTVACGIGLYILGVALAGTHPPPGMRAGMTMAISMFITAFFLTMAVGETIQDRFLPRPDQQSIGFLALGAIGAGLLVLAGWWFLSPGFGRFLVGFEEQGWFTFAPYKRMQGLRVRRFTILGVLLLLGCGIYTLMSSRALVSGPEAWTVVVPFTNGDTITVLPDLQYTVPLLMAGLTLWFAYRLVNWPAFADFLIATEAEMNKVSWTTRKRLIQDTIVVLVTTALLTAFLLACDLLWGWVFHAVGIVPKPKPPENTKIVREQGYE